jgi:hypothetical protein
VCAAGAREGRCFTPFPQEALIVSDDSRRLSIPVNVLLQMLVNPLAQRSTLEENEESSHSQRSAEEYSGKITKELFTGLADK